MRTKLTSLAAVTLLALAACGSDSNNTDAVEPPSDRETRADQTRRTTPKPTPTPQPLPTYLLGEEITMSNARITIHSVEAVDQLDTDQFADTLVPSDGESLHRITWEWTNLSNEPGWGVCFGPMDTYMAVYDFDDHQLAEHPDSYAIAGNDCEMDVLTGQGGIVHDAFRGLEGADVAYITLENFNTGTREIVVTDPSVQIFEEWFE